MIFKIRQGFTLQQSSEHPGLISRFLHGCQVLNLPEDHHPLDPLLWASILEYRKLSGVLETLRWVIWIHEKLQLDPLRLVLVSPISLVHLLHLGNKRNGGFSPTEGGKTAEDLENLLISIDWIEILQTNVITVLYIERTISIHGSHLF
jgi:hypothetical protein